MKRMEESVEQHPSPQIQRLAVLSAYSISVHNATLFIQQMEKSGFPKDRLLTLVTTRCHQFPV